jgi:hypothetical protein
MPRYLPASDLERWAGSSRYGRRPARQRHGRCHGRRVAP